MWPLHEALTDLGDATGSVPTPIRTAVDAELETEARWLHDAFAEYTKGVEIPDDETRCTWDFEDPFVAFDGGWGGLGSQDRDVLDRLEAAATGQELHDAIVDIRLLLDADAQLNSSDSRLQMDARPAWSKRAGTVRPTDRTTPVSGARPRRRSRSRLFGRTGARKAHRHLRDGSAKTAMTRCASSHGHKRSPNRTHAASAPSVSLRAMPQPTARRWATPRVIGAAAGRRRCVAGCRGGRR